MTVRYNSNREEITRRLNEAVAAGLKAVGIFVEGETINRTPVRTGRLRDSYTHEVDETANEVVIGSNVEYAPYVEFGTSRQEAQPHLRPAITQNIDRIRRLVEEEIQRRMR